jgi:hypothetical protein
MSWLEEVVGGLLVAGRVVALFGALAGGLSVLVALHDAGDPGIGRLRRRRKRSRR